MISVVLGFHLCVSRRSLQLTLALVCWWWLGCFLLVSVGELIFDLFLTSSNNLTATVESNAATEKKKYKVEFWHAHLNYACLRASDARLPGGGAARLAGDQLCHWNILSPDAVFQATHLIVFLPSDAVGLQCWVNFCLLAGTNGLFFGTNCLQIARQGTSANGRVAD